MVKLAPPQQKPQKNHSKWKDLMKAAMDNRGETTGIHLTYTKCEAARKLLHRRHQLPVPLTSLRSVIKTPQMCRNTTQPQKKQEQETSIKTDTLLH